MLALETLSGETNVALMIGSDATIQSKKTFGAKSPGLCPGEGVSLRISPPHTTSVQLGRSHAGPGLGFPGISLGATDLQDLPGQLRNGYMRLGSHTNVTEC